MVAQGIEPWLIDIGVNEAIEVTGFAAGYRKLERDRIPARVTSSR